MKLTLFNENNAFLIAASVFPYFYALVGERNPKLAPKPGPRSPYSQLACDTFELIRRDGPIAKAKIAGSSGRKHLTAPRSIKLWASFSPSCASRASITKPSEGGSFWDVLYRWSPEAVREGMDISVAQALSALVTKYLDCVVAAEPAELEIFLGNFVARSRVKEAINALLAARELSFVHVGGKSMLQITPAKEPAVTTTRPYRAAK